MAHDGKGMNDGGELHLFRHVVSFIAGFIDGMMIDIDEATISKAHSMYWNLS